MIADPDFTPPMRVQALGRLDALGFEVIASLRLEPTCSAMIIHIETYEPVTYLPSGIILQRLSDWRRIFTVVRHQNVDERLERRAYQASTEREHGIANCEPLDDDEWFRNLLEGSEHSGNT